MPKINKEEYEILKEAQKEGYQLLGRNRNDNVLRAYTNDLKSEKKIKNIRHIREDGTSTLTKFFGFITKEDSEYYTITELVEEYERHEIGNIHVERKHPMFNCNRFNGFYNANIAIWDRLDESEETEVKKDIEWLISEIDQRVEAHKETTPYNTGVATGMRSSLFLINQLDEPEVLSQEWVSDNAVAGQYPDGMGYVVPAYKLQNLLVPKQEEVDLAYRKGFKEGERQTAEYFESITEEPSKEQVWKYLSEHGIEVVDKEPETVANVVSTFWKSYERLKEVMNIEVEELEE